MIEFEDVAALGRSGGLLFLEIDALHMLAIADSARSRERAAEAVDRALAAPDDRLARRWLVSLYNTASAARSLATSTRRWQRSCRRRDGQERVGTEQQRAWAREAIQGVPRPGGRVMPGEPGFRRDQAEFLPYTDKPPS